MTIGTPDGVFIHHLGLCESQAVGRGTRIWAFTHIMDGASIGADCNIGGQCFVESGARIGHRVTVKNGVSVWRGVEIGDDAFVGPNVTFTNDLRPRAFRKKGPSALLNTRVEQGATIGANATVLCGITLGAYCFVGAGSVVGADVEPYALVFGSPARHRGWVCSCGERLDDQLVCPSGARYDRAQEGAGLRENRAHIRDG
ncbi:MAG TPA: acyltransferase [Acidimicrobiales bacterium]|nr:acyltransferase [Acidimicrobiales bacterium]